MRAPRTTQVRRRLGLVLCASFAAAGCSTAPRHADAWRTAEPVPPAALQQLAQLAGAWETSGEVRMIGLDDPLIVTGHNHAQWTCDGRVLVDRSTFEMGALGPMAGTNVWSWDSRRSRFRLWWFDSFGESATGHARYDAAKRTWHMRTRGTNGWCRIFSRGTIHHVNDDTLEWTWRQSDSWGWFTIADMRGTSRRKS